MEDKTVATALDLEGGRPEEEEGSRSRSRRSSRQGRRLLLCLSVASLVAMAAAAGVLLALLLWGAGPGSWREHGQAGPKTGAAAAYMSESPDSNTQSAVQTLKQMGQLPQNPAAHLVANSSQQPGTPLRWLSDMNQAFLQQGMELSAEGRELLVPRAGLYFLYAQATFSSSSPGAGDPCGGRSEPLSLRVERHSPSYPDFVPLLNAARSLCPPGGPGGAVRPGQFWTVPLYQAALFKLLAGDRLRVAAGPLRLLDDQKTFLGAFAVAPEPE